MLKAEQKKIMEEYIQSLEDYEREAYSIAKKQLKSSFSLEKSIGYKRYVEEKKKKSI